MKSRRTRKLVWLMLILAVLLLTCCVTASVLSARETAQRQSLYLEMRDGVKIAIDVWLPVDLKPGQKLPTILRSTRYWRSYQPGPMAPTRVSYSIISFVTKAICTIVVSIRSIGERSINVQGQRAVADICNRYRC